MKKFTISQTIALDTQAKALQRAGHDVINLSVGELDFPVPPPIQEAVAIAVSAHSNRYSAVAGLPEARQAAVDYEFKQHQVHYQPEQVLVSNGAKQALATAFLALLEPGDEVLILQPAWVSYVEQIKLAGGVPVSVETTDQFQPDVAAIQSVITKRTVGIILNYPNNPTGAVYGRTVLQQIADLAQQQHWWVVSDEIYEHIIYDGTEFLSFASLYPNTITVNGLSKANAVTGWRIGYAAGPKDIITAMTAVQSHVTGNVSNVMQAALVPGLATGLSAEWLAELQQRRQLVVDALHSPPPAGAFYCFIDIRRFGLDSITFCQRLLQDYHVALVPGTYFGRDGFVRLSFANNQPNLRTALERLVAFYAILPQ
ncbi:MAG: hypothetical protein ACD_41C00177G0015 [uncultured bacterium]|nr:MAG: hypothetical protein ACD_41C00177G0015 [uncultured bacterium]